MMEDFFKASRADPYIDNEQVESKKVIDHISPVLKEKWISLGLGGASDVARAIDSSEKGLKALEELTAYERAAILHNMATLLRFHKKHIAEIITKEMGKTITGARGEVEYAANYFDWFAEEGKRVYGSSIPPRMKGKQILMQHEPVGIVGVITPWNFPIAMGARKIAPAIAAGCPSIVKPDMGTAVSMLAIAEIAKEAGLPKGALHVIPGNAEQIGEALLSDSRVRKLTFTGSTEVGKLLYAKCTPTLKKVTLELGGHAPAIVFDDADLEIAATEVINAKLRNSGQTCVCANRIYVHSSILQPFVEALVAKVEKLSTGNPLSEESDLTNVLHHTSMKKVARHVADAKKQGATCHLGGNHPYEPTIISGITPEMILYTEETFGPVFPICSFETEEEAIQRANNTPYGLAAYAFTQDITRAFRVTKALEYGIIGLNDGLPSTVEAPFGGVKNSGMGREGGAVGIYEYLTEKTISIGWIKQ